MNGNELREATKIIADLTKAGFTPEEIAVFLDNPYQAYSTEMGRIGVLVMLQRGMKERTLLKKIGSMNLTELWEKCLIAKHDGETTIVLTQKGISQIQRYANERKVENVSKV